MKAEKYIEVSMMQDGFMLTDWTDWFQHHLENNNFREMTAQSSGWVTVQGNTTNYHIKGFGKNEQRAKQFAIWYHVNKSIGSISTYRLD